MEQHVCTGGNGCPVQHDVSMVCAICGHTLDSVAHNTYGTQPQPGHPDGIVLHLCGHCHEAIANARWEVNGPEGD